MAVTKEITRLEKSNIRMNITVPRDDVRSRYQDMLKEYSKNLQIPGFRKGKVPQEVLERKYSEALRGEAMGRIIEGALQDIFKEEEMPRGERPLPYSAPELEGEPKLDFEQDLQFAVVYDVLPEVKIGQWQGLTVEYPYAEIGDDDINKELEEIRERNAIVMDRDDDAASQKGDVVTIDYQIFEENSEEMPSDSQMGDLQRKDFAFTLGSGNNGYNFDDDITGMKKGETKEFSKKFDDNFFQPALAGKTRKVQVTLTALKEKKLPDLNDDLAQDVDEKFETLNDLKNSIKERLDKSLEWRLKDKKLNELLKKMMENTPIVLPESMVRTEIEGRWRKLARYYNTNAETLMQMMANDPNGEQRDKEWRESAEKALHSRLIIETIMEEQKIEVTDDDVEKEFEKIASESSSAIDEVKKNYNEQAIFYLKEEIRERRIIEILLAENTLKPGKKENYLDFMSDNG